MQRKIMFVVIALLTLSYAEELIFAAPTGRIANIKDSAGTTTSVSNLRFSWKENSLTRGLFDQVYSRDQVIIIATSSFQMGIPLESLTSMVCKRINSKDPSSGYTYAATFCELKYQFQGRDQTVSGNILNDTLHGESDFGAFAVDVEKLREIAYTTPGTSQRTTPIAFNQHLVLRDCTGVPAAELARFVSYCSSSGYIVGCSDVFRRHKDIRFYRGDSLVTVPFSNVRTMVFEAPHERWADAAFRGTVTVILKSGSQATGRLGDSFDDALWGFTGVYEKGQFFLPAEYLRAISFGEQGSVECKVPGPAGVGTKK